LRCRFWFMEHLVFRKGAGIGRSYKEIRVVL
jgi:hypothetical protein